MVAGDNRRVNIGLSDPAELSSLRNWLGLARGVDVRQISALPGNGELGSGDVLSVIAVAGSSALVAAFRMLPEFLRSRRSSLSISVMTGKQKLIINLENVDEVMPLLDRLIDD
jgi:Effector Associated Constant Component 1